MTDRISQLESENDALRSKCAELTKAVSEKTELVSTLEAAQSRIEESILKTIDRLDSVEDSILNSSDGQSSAQESSSTAEASEDFISEPEVSESNIPEQTEDPFVYEQETQSEENSGLLHKTVTAETSTATVSQPQVFENSAEEQEALKNSFSIEEEEENTPSPSALDGQFDIF